MVATATATATAVADGEGPTTTPRWWLPLVVWRVVAVALIAAVPLLAVTQVGVEFDGIVRWGVTAGGLAMTALAATAAYRTIRPTHLGRFTGFVTDGIVAVVAGFIALNTIGVFTGIDVAGEAFNRAAGWSVLIVIGWLVRAIAFRGPTTNDRLAAAGRWLMIAGFALLLLFMGILPGLLEFGQRLLWSDVIGFAAIAVAAVVSTRLLWSDSATRFFGSTQQQSETLEGMLFIAPNALGFATFFAGPLIASLFFSFTEWDGLTEAEFVGFDNYVALFSDDLFLTSLRNIAIFGLIAIPAAVVPALVLAALLNADLPGMRVFRAVYFLPSIGGVVGVTLIWKQLFNSTVGFINYGLLRSTDAVNAVLGTDFTAAQPQWISDSSIALFAVIILFAWQQIGFNTVLFLAGMQGIDRGLYEAADLDGAGAVTKFLRITVPLLRSTTVFVVATTTILGLQMFNEPFILQSPSSPAGPNNSTLTPVVYLYQNAFQQFEIGYASAVAWALFILIFALTLLYFRRGDGQEIRL